MVHLTKHETAMFLSLSNAEYVKRNHLHSSIIESLSAKGLLNRIEFHFPYCLHEDKIKCSAYAGTGYVLNSNGIRQLFEMGRTDNLTPFDINILIRISKHEDVSKIYNERKNASILSLIKRGYCVLHPNLSFSTTKAGEELLDQRCRQDIESLSADKLLLSYYILSKVRDTMKGDEAVNAANCQLQMLSSQIESLIR